MEIDKKIVLVFLIIGLVIIWNVFIVPLFVSVFIKLSQIVIGESDLTMYLNNNKSKIIYFFQVFYWIGLAVIVIGLIRS